VVLTYDGTNVTLFIDGTQTDSQPVPFTLNTTPGTGLVVGASIGNYGSFYGHLQDAAVFPTALSAAQVSALHAAK
jgi:hypothetical protein